MWIHNVPILGGKAKYLGGSQVFFQIFPVNAVGRLEKSEKLYCFEEMLNAKINCVKTISGTNI